MEQSLGCRTRGVSLNTLKLIAIASMLVDHIAYAFVPDGTALAIVMHFIGRFTGPTMFFAAVEGWHHTHDLRRYLLRLGVFALLSWYPFLFFKYGTEIQSWLRPNVIFTIFMGVLAVTVRRSERLHVALKVLLIAAIFALCVPADWGTTGLLLILVLDLFYGNFKQQAAAYCIVALCACGLLDLLMRPFFSLFYEGVFTIDMELLRDYLPEFGMFVPIAALAGYHGVQGRRTLLTKWGFYLFYPAHLLLLGWLQVILK